MRNVEKWEPTKFVFRNGRLHASKNRKHLGVGSRLITELAASAYEKFIPMYCRGKLADVGCGHMPLYACYKKHVDDVVAVDWADSLHQNEYLDIIADLNEPPIHGIKDQSIDTIICSDVLEHLYKPKKLFEDFHRILTPGGHALINVPFYYWIHESPHDYYRYTEWALKRFSLETGFEMVEFMPLGGVFASWIDLTSKGLSGCGGLGRFIAGLVQSLVLASYSISIFRRLSLMKADLVPLGYFFVIKKRCRHTIES